MLYKILDKVMLDTEKRLPSTISTKNCLNVSNNTQDEGTEGTKETMSQPQIMIEELTTKI